MRVMKGAILLMLLCLSVFSCTKKSSENDWRLYLKEMESFCNEYSGVIKGMMSGDPTVLIKSAKIIEKYNKLVDRSDYFENNLKGDELAEFEAEYQKILLKFTLDSTGILDQFKGLF